MKLTFLDSASVGDVDLSAFEKYGDFTRHDLTGHENLAERIKDTDVVITNKVYFGAAEMDMAKNLKLIAVAATGYNNIDLHEAKKRKISVANVSSYSTHSVAQLTFTTILALQSSLLENLNDVNNLEWNKSNMFTMLRHDFRLLKGKKLGIIGYGEIGKKVVEIGKAFEMEIMVAKRPKVSYNEKWRYEFDDVLKQADVISIHCPLTAETENLIDSREFALMKKTALLINTARGKIVNEDALYNAIKNKKIWGSALDVLSEEPPRNGNKLIGLDRVLITPHIAWAAKESREKLISGICDNIEKFLEGTLISLTQSI